MVRFFIYTMGCKVNDCDSSDFSSNLLSYGFELSDSRNANIIIVNSCAVTSESVRKARQHINKFRKENSNAFIILTGCASVLSEFKRNKSLNAIVNRDELIDFILSKFDSKKVKRTVFNNKTRAFMKIEDGCENFCSYCIIPFTRGNIKSKALEDIRDEAKYLSEAGFKEIILTGINLGKYGKDINLTLINAIDEVSKYFKRIRLSSLEPDTVDEKLITKLSEYDKICPHFHLSLQSGSDRILRAMNRRYDVGYYLSVVSAFREKFEDVTFATDVIVGFPGEDDCDFDATLKLIEQVSFVKVNVFPFSPRPFTSAECLEQFNLSLKKSRVRRAIAHSNSVSKSEISKFVGKSMNVLFECKKGEDLYEGYSGNYICVKCRSRDDLCGKVKCVVFSF